MKTVRELGATAKAASRALALAASAQKNAALTSAARALDERRALILEANALDVKNARAGGMSEAFIDRLTLTDARIDGMIEGVLEIVGLKDPVGVMLERRELECGLSLEKITTPIGVIAVIFESRPNVAADSAALCIKSGNAVILRGGKEAINSTTAICAAFSAALAEAELPAEGVQLVGDTTRESATQLMTLNEYIDLLIPRGGRGLIRSVVDNASVPVIETGAGVCHVYVDKDADLDMAAKILFNAKTSRPSVCNACECALVHKDIAAEFLPKAKALLDAIPVEIRGDERTREIIPGCTPAAEDDWGCEYNDMILACRVVDSVDEAIEHVARCGTGHSEAIVTDNISTAESYLNRVDAAAVYHNASTRFTDGGVFGLGAEIGISTQKLHARGPLGLMELMSYKYKLRGAGQVR